VPASKFILLIIVFFLTALVSVVTGSTALITVPTMIAVGIEPHVAVATNMLTLIFLSVGGALSFNRKGVIERSILPIGAVLTVIGSGIGAFLLLDIPTRALELTIAVAMIVIAFFSLLRRDGDAARYSVSAASRTTGYVLTFVLAVYGGLFSGGYVTILTAVFVFCFGLSFIQSVATTKVINIFSSLVATAIFAWRGVVNYQLGVVLGVTMFVGALVGGHVAMRLPAVWLRRIFIVAVIGLAAKMTFAMLR
jgi:uncharacterized protein